MKHMVRILALAFGGVILVFCALHLFLQPRWFRTVEGDGWRTDMPMLALSPTRSTEGPWTFVGTDGSASFRVGTLPMSGEPGPALDAAEAALHPRPVERIDVPSLGGRFLLSGRGKSWRASLLFPAGGRVFDVESLEGRGNAAEPLFTVARMVAALEIDASGTSFAAPPEETLDDVIRPAVARHLAGMDTMLPVLVPILLLAFTVAFATIRVSGRVPEPAPGMPPPLRVEGNVFISLRRSRWVFRKTMGALVLGPEGLHVSSLGRELAFVPTSGLGSIRRLPGTGRNRPFRFERNGLEVRFLPDDPDAWQRMFVSPQASI